ncbi:MAG TPA: two pore domain potassium channel family protein [Burkholderiaceae bacterium]|nr:two pore domain potassium channel family protein [Burkholderiaceae bacterium]
MYESKEEALLSRRAFAARMLWHLVIAFLLVAVVIVIGMLGHLLFEPVKWHDAILNISLIAAGIGPLMLPETVAGKVFFALYNVLVNVVFVALIGVVMAPLVHRMLHKFHLDDDEG